MGVIRCENRENLQLLEVGRAATFQFLEHLRSSSTQRRISLQPKFMRLLWHGKPHGKPHDPQPLIQPSVSKHLFQYPRPHMRFWIIHASVPAAQSGSCHRPREANPSQCCPLWNPCRHDQQATARGPNRDEGLAALAAAATASRTRIRLARRPSPQRRPLACCSAARRRGRTRGQYR